MNTETRRNLLSAALAYSERGWSVFPLAVRAKVPLREVPVMTYQRERRATTDEILAWWNRNPANIAIATGAISGLFVWDCDTEQAYQETLQHGLHRTLIARTGKGYHIYFQCPDFTVNNRAGIKPHVDVRGNGGYVVAPPSIHPLGHIYQWLDDTAPIRQAPDWILQLLIAKPITKPASRPLHFNSHSQSSRYGLAALRSEAHEVACTTGNRNDRLYRAALKMGSLIALGSLQQATVINYLLSAADHSGLSADDGESQSYRTILSGINRGMESPRGSSNKT